MREYERLEDGRNGIANGRCALGERKPRATKLGTRSNALELEACAGVDHAGYLVHAEAKVDRRPHPLVWLVPAGGDLALVDAGLLQYACKSWE